MQTKETLFPVVIISRYQGISGNGLSSLAQWEIHCYKTFIFKIKEMIKAICNLHVIYRKKRYIFVVNV